MMMMLVFVATIATMSVNREVERRFLVSGWMGDFCSFTNSYNVIVLGDEGFEETDV